MLKIYYEDNATEGEITVSLNDNLLFQKYDRELRANDLRKIFKALNIEATITEGKYP